MKPLNQAISFATPFLSVIGAGSRNSLPDF
jgi:hypothetical protein